MARVFNMDTSSSQTGSTWTRRAPKGPHVSRSHFGVEGKLDVPELRTFVLICRTSAHRRNGKSHQIFVLLLLNDVAPGQRKDNVIAIWWLFCLPDHLLLGWGQVGWPQVSMSTVIANVRFSSGGQYWTLAQGKRHCNQLRKRDDAQVGSQTSSTNSQVMIFLTSELNNLLFPVKQHSSYSKSNVNGTRANQNLTMSNLQIIWLDLYQLN